VPPRGHPRGAGLLRDPRGVVVEGLLAALLLHLPRATELEEAREVGVLRRLALVEELLDPLVLVALRVEVELDVALEAVVPDLRRVIDLRGGGEHVLLEEGVAEQGDELPLLVDALVAS
jgi:hypothetical protein